MLPEAVLIPAVAGALAFTGLKLRKRPSTVVSRFSSGPWLLITPQTWACRRHCRRGFPTSRNASRWSRTRSLT
jgi:hypothetical protein